MDKFEIKVGSFKVVRSGSVIFFNYEPVVFELSDLKFRLSFHDGDNLDESNKLTPWAEVDLMGENENKYMDIKFYNGWRLEWAGPSEPMLVGVYNNEDLFLSYRTKFIGSSKKEGLLFYSFLSKAKEVVDGE